MVFLKKGFNHLLGSLREIMLHERGEHQGFLTFLPWLGVKAFREQIMKQLVIEKDAN